MKISNKPAGTQLPTTDATSNSQTTGKAARAGANGVDAILTKSTGKPTGAANSTRVDVSERGQQVKKAKDLASKDLNSVDEAKVARLQKMIDDGNYKVDAEALADRLVDEHLNMPS
jgi:negative regulator of flagellin synthesis FlgM